LRDIAPLGSAKHSETPYWPIPHSLAADLVRLRDMAYEAADLAHLAFSFDIGQAEQMDRMVR